MSEEQQHPRKGVPAETQPSGGFGGERRDSGADELLPQAEASERSLSRRVSRETEKPPKNRPSSAYLYLLILFGAAFVLLLLAYFVQKRNSESTISGLQDSWNLSREELMEENRRLTEKNEELEVWLAVMEDARDRAHRQIDELEAQLYEVQVQYDGARNQASHLEYWLYKRSEAMELFGRLDKADAQGNRQLCLNLIEWMERPDGGPLKDFLPDARDRESYDFGVADGPTPAERYQAIVEKLS